MDGWMDGWIDRWQRKGDWSSLKCLDLSNCEGKDRYFRGRNSARIGWKNDHHQRVGISKNICQELFTKVAKISSWNSEVEDIPKPWKQQKSVPPSLELFIDDHQPQEVRLATLTRIWCGNWSTCSGFSQPFFAEPWKRFKKKTGFSSSYSHGRWLASQKKCFGKGSEVPFVRCNWRKKKRALSCAFWVGEGIILLKAKIIRTKRTSSPIQKLQEKHKTSRWIRMSSRRKKNHASFNLVMLPKTGSPFVGQHLLPLFFGPLVHWTEKPANVLNKLVVEATHLKKYCDRHCWIIFFRSENKKKIFELPPSSSGISCFLSGLFWFHWISMSFIHFILWVVSWWCCMLDLSDFLRQRQYAYKAAESRHNISQYQFVTWSQTLRTRSVESHHPYHMSW